MTQSVQGAKYLELLRLSRSEAVDEIAKLVSDLSDAEHKTRSSILDVHFTLEFELKRFLYHSLRGTISYSDTEDRDQKASRLNKSIASLPVGTVLKILDAGLKDRTWSDLGFAWEINSTRNKLAHERDLSQVLYKKRSPFVDRDCLAQIFFDLWAFKQTLAKAFEFKIETPLVMLKYYRSVSEIYEAKYGPLSEEERPRIPDYPEW